MQVEARREDQIHAEIAVLQAMEKRGEFIRRGDVMRLAEEVDNLFTQEEIDGDTAWHMHVALFLLDPEK